jgi:hypothetical protein
MFATNDWNLEAFLVLFFNQSSPNPRAKHFLEFSAVCSSGFF